MNRFSNEARMALNFAREEAQRLRQRPVGTEHLLLGVLKAHDPLIEGIFALFHVSTTRVAQALEFVVGSGNKAYLGEPSLSAAARAVLLRAEREAELVDADLIGLDHLLLAFFCERDSVTVGVLESFGISVDQIRLHILSLTAQGFQSAALSHRYQTRYNETPTLNAVSRDLTLEALAHRLDPLIGREVELERTMQILARRSKNNPVLLGQAGVGKTAIAEGLALRIIEGQVPEQLQHFRVVALDAGLLTVGTKFRGDFEERLKRIAQEILTNRHIIIVIDELHTLVGTGVAEGSIDAANLFKPMLARGEFQCLGATTLEDYRRTIEADPALERRFQPVFVPETTPQETLEILRGLRPHYANFHNVTISDEALVAAIQFSSRYIQNRYQPDNAIDLIDEAAARASVLRSIAPDPIRLLREEVVEVQRAKDYAIAHRDFSTASKHRTKELRLCRKLHDIEQHLALGHNVQQAQPVIGEQEIAHVVTMRTGIPLTRIASEEADRLLKLEDELHRRVIGQLEAVRAVSRAVRRSRANIGDSRRPVGSFLFLGPTGVGKTELARALAATLFDDEQTLIKLDMSEFMESHHVARLIGSPPGYVGYEEPGQLTEAVHRRPYSVVLFDEIEKAHPKVFDLLLQLLEDGCLTDARGQTVDFKHTLIIMTSNVGAAHLQRGTMSFAIPARQHDTLHAAQPSVPSEVMESLKAIFRPELLNRIDEIVQFHPLELSHLRQIVDLLITQTESRLWEQAIALQVTKAARDFLIERGYEPSYGARPLRRAVQRLLEDLLAEAILQGNVASGDAVIVDMNSSSSGLSLHVMQKAEVPLLAQGAGHLDER
jgi:ATP-dependent Clp protease ATP-binding subunit ClpC